MNYNKDGPG